ncbi:MAG: hypothetical protein CMG00_06655 [Candidatus Marinimicrobia bacterium]|nr:hypothetical protein [Candidatus Neomarinimicrobiota bacterium]|tara:strand:+ start:123 stop:800 length:678 start_codon:yes stop_codon:yes gene_type:complete
MVFDFSHYFDDKIKLYLTKVDSYWDQGFSLASRRKRVVEYFNLSDKIVSMPEQIHGDKVEISTSNNQSLKCDAIIYDAQDVVGIISVADCVPVCIYDNVKEQIALIHSGWKGTDKKIILKTIDIMKKKGSMKDDLKVFLGPSIRSCCYKVGDSLYRKFHKSVVADVNGKLFVDLALQIKFDLNSIGIAKHNINVSKLCTYDSLNCHSYRRDGKMSGRMSFIAFKN